MRFKVLPLLVTRSVGGKYLSDAPTAFEPRMPDYAVQSSLGIVAPAGTPDAAIHRLSGELIKTMGTKESSVGILKIGLEPTSNTPERFRSVIKSDWPKWSAAVKASGADSK